VNATVSFNHAHDKAQLLARRHERDLHWAKERRREHERETAEARALLADRALTQARATLWTAGTLLLATAGGYAIALGMLDLVWSTLAAGIAVASAIVVLLGAGVSLGRLRSRRAAARALLHSRDARLSHTQFHIHESVHSFIDARVDVVNTRGRVSA
jgi:hypothetical protein